MNGNLMLYRDQYGNTFFARTVKELCEKLCRTNAKKMYRDIDGASFHVGYVIGEHWLTAYQPVLKG